MVVFCQGQNTSKRSNNIVKRNKCTLLLNKDSYVLLFLKTYVYYSPFIATFSIPFDSVIFEETLTVWLFLSFVIKRCYKADICNANPLNLTHFNGKAMNCWSFQMVYITMRYQVHYFISLAAAVIEKVVSQQRLFLVLVLFIFSASTVCRQTLINIK